MTQTTRRQCTKQCSILYQPLGWLVGQALTFHSTFKSFIWILTMHVYMYYSIIIVLARRRRRKKHTIRLVEYKIRVQYIKARMESWCVCDALVSINQSIDQSINQSISVVFICVSVCLCIYFNPTTVPRCHHRARQLMWSVPG